KLFSFLGTENFYILIFPVVYWCFDTGLGIRLALALLSTSSINCLLKIGIHLPRPYWVDTRVITYASEPTFGFPSGHSQMAASVWGMHGFYQRNKWTAWAAGFMIFMIGISRLYLGVHFLTDVLGGWLLGFLVLLLINQLDRPVSRWISRTSPGVLFLYAAIPGILLLLLGIAIQFNLHTWQIPESWVEISARSGSLINPTSLKDLYSSVGTWIGFIAGICWLRSQESSLGKFRNGGNSKQKLWRYLIGIAGILILWSGPGLTFPNDETLAGLAFRLLRYALIGWWISGLAPFISIRLRMVNPEKPFDVESNVLAQ
ncbi:MAG TPA: phosphatase PAP2 family protein, partial [Leptolinea sp.]